MKPNYVYVASSWRNPMHDAVVQVLRAAHIDCYDFKGDDTAKFHWSEVGVDSNSEDVAVYLQALKKPRAREGFNSDYAAMGRADCCVLVLPCGRSAHLELGWMVAKGKRTAILLDGTDKVNPPELMYKMVDYIAPDIYDLLGWLGVKD